MSQGRDLLRVSVRPLCLLSNSSKKPLFFDVLKVTFRYLSIEDGQGSSVVKKLGEEVTTEIQRIH